MDTNDTYDLIIIGGGPGGLGAGIYAMRAAMKTLLIEKGAMGGQVTMSDSVDNYLGFEHVGAAELSMKFADHAASYGLEVQNQEVTGLEPGIDCHRVHLSDGQVLKTHAVILSTGGSPKKLGIDGEDTNYGKGVSYCAVCDGFFFRNKTVLVVGGGDSATEEALYLAKIARKVYIVHRRDKLRAGAILQKRVMGECKIEMVWDSGIERIVADAGGVNGVEIRNFKTGASNRIDTDGVFIFIGFLPNNHLVPAGVKLNVDGYVVTDDKCETNIPGIYAVGDLREKYARQIITAAADGCTAALAAAHFVESKKATSGESCPVP
jgi:thioredoxin reductase (NADPH)